MSGRTLALIESGVAAAALPAADVLLQAVTASGFGAIDYRQIAAAAVVGFVTYLIAFLRALPILPPGSLVAVPLPQVGTTGNATNIVVAPTAPPAETPPSV